MRSRGFVRAALFLALLTVLAAGASAQITMSGGFALSSMEVKIEGYTANVDSEIGLGGNVYVDYLLPIGVPLSLGAEIGFDTAVVDDSGFKLTGNVIPLLLRVAYHFDLMANLDLYLVGKVGYVLGFAEYTDGDTEDGFGGIGFGFDVGAAYYLTPRFGAFFEGGFDRYNLEKDIDGLTVKVPFSRFVTLGVSVKF
jgi:hypothetical protein